MRWMRRRRVVAGPGHPMRLIVKAHFFVRLWLVGLFAILVWHDPLTARIRLILTDGWSHLQQLQQEQARHASIQPQHPDRTRNRD